MADNLVLCVFSAGLGRAMAGNDVRIPALDQVERGDGMLANRLLIDRQLPVEGEAAA